MKEEKRFEWVYVNSSRSECQLQSHYHCSGWRRFMQVQQGSDAGPEHLSWAAKHRKAEKCLTVFGAKGVQNGLTGGPGFMLFLLKLKSLFLGRGRDSRYRSLISRFALLNGL